MNLITSARNEQAFIEKTIQSVVCQIQLPALGSRGRRIYRCNRRIARDSLGAPRSLGKHWLYDFSDTSYVGPLLGDRNHWVRQLPGQLFHNVVSHGIAKLAEFLDGDLAELLRPPSRARSSAASAVKKCWMNYV